MSGAAVRPRDAPPLAEFGLSNRQHWSFAAFNGVVYATALVILGVFGRDGSMGAAFVGAFVGWTLVTGLTGLWKRHPSLEIHQWGIVQVRSAVNRVSIPWVDITDLQAVAGPWGTRLVAEQRPLPPGFGPTASPTGTRRSTVLAAPRTGLGPWRDPAFADKVALVRGTWEQYRDLGLPMATTPSPSHGPPGIAPPPDRAPDLDIPAAARRVRAVALLLAGSVALPATWMLIATSEAMGAGQSVASTDVLALVALGFVFSALLAFIHTRTWTGKVWFESDELVARFSFSSDRIAWAAITDIAEDRRLGARRAVVRRGTSVTLLPVPRSGWIAVDEQFDEELRALQRAWLDATEDPT